jgi:uncharacterized protein (TIGR03083 family)
MDGPAAESFASASAFLLEAVALTSPEDWGRPALGGWQLLELIAHANRAHTTLEEYLRNPQPPQRADSTYFSEEAIAARGREAVAALGDDPLASVASCSRRAIALVAEAPADATVGSPSGTMTLAHYLPTRTAELTVHALDVGRVIGVQLVAPREALGESLSFLGRKIAPMAEASAVLLALSGRGELPEGFSAY